VCPKSTQSSSSAHHILCVHYTRYRYTCEVFAGIVLHLTVFLGRLCSVEPLQGGRGGSHLSSVVPHAGPRSGRIRTYQSIRLYRVAWTVGRCQKPRGTTWIVSALVREEGSCMQARRGAALTVCRVSCSPRYILTTYTAHSWDNPKLLEMSRVRVLT